MTKCCKCIEFNWSDPQEVIYTDPQDNRCYCIFHAPSKNKGVNNSEFNEIVISYINSHNSNTKALIPIILSGTVFPGAISFSNIKLGILNSRFDHCIFNDKAIFSNLKILNSSFSRVKFCKRADFISSEFRGKSLFNNSQFSSKCYFDGSIFYCPVYFTKTRFIKSVYLRNTTFASYFNFKSAESKSRISFKNVEFRKTASFKNIQSKGYIRIECSKFFKTSTFSNSKIDNIHIHATEFKSHTTFKEAKINSLRIDESKFHGKTSFKKMQVDSAYLYYTTFFDEVSFLLSKFINSFFEQLLFDKIANFTSMQIEGGLFSITKTDLYNFYLLRTEPTNIYINESCWPKCNGRISVPYENESDKLQLARDFYQRMKRKYKNEHNEYEASKWHISEKEAQLKILKHRKSYFLHTMLQLYKLSSQYGENPFRAALLLFALLFIPLITLTVMTYSTITGLSTLNLGDIDQLIKSWLSYIPLSKSKISEGTTGINHLIMFIWQTLTTIQAALFAFALRNRLRR